MIEFNQKGELKVNLEAICYVKPKEPELIKVISGYKNELSPEFYEAYRNMINFHDKKNESLQLEFLKAMQFYQSAIKEPVIADLKTLVKYILDNLPVLNIKLNRICWDIYEKLKNGKNQYFTNEQREIIIKGNDLIKKDDNYKNIFKFFVASKFDPNYQFIDLSQNEVKS